MYLVISKKKKNNKHIKIINFIMQKQNIAIDQKIIISTREIIISKIQ